MMASFRDTRKRGDRFDQAFAPLCCLFLAACGAAGPLVPTSQDGPPTIAAVRDGLGEDVDTQDVRSSLHANWDAFVDPEGGPVVYEWCVGTSPGGTEVVNWTPTGGVTRGTVHGIDLPLGVPLHVSVRGLDLQGNRSSISTSDGVVIGKPIVVERGTTPGTPAPVPQQGHYAALDRHGITWTFDRPTQAGRFVNGDWWVVGPLSIVAITPTSVVDGDRVRHGSMLNPSAAAPVQGYDNAMFGSGSTAQYADADNVALRVAKATPLVLQPGSSLVSAISHPLAGQMPQLETCAVLTILDAAPPPDSFRPPYCGTDKKCRWSADRLDLSRLARLDPPPGTPLIPDLLERFERTWLDHVPGWTGRFLHPRANMPDYGRDLADLVGLGALLLQLEQRPADKRLLAIAMTQIGIDLYGIVRDGGRFVADGGSGSGRKFPILLAGALLQDEALLRCAHEQHQAFAEDVQTFYVAQTEPGVFNHGHGGYGADDVGLPEWGNRHADDPSFDTKSWTGDPYRRCCTANAWHGFVLATRIMGLRDVWGHPALFDYVDRYMQIEPRGAWTRSWNPFAERMWDLYRPSF